MTRGRPRGRRGRERLGVNSEINVTPLVDVVLVLLIIFMVVTPYLAQGVEVTLPFAPHGQPDPGTEETIVVTVKPDGQIYLGHERVSRQQLLERVRAQLARTPDRDILLRGDARTKYGKVEDLMLWLRASGAPGVLLATTKERS